MMEMLYADRLDLVKLLLSQALHTLVEETSAAQFSWMKLLALEVNRTWACVPFQMVMTVPTVRMQV